MNDSERQLADTVRDAAEATLCAEDRIEAVAGCAVNVSGGRPVSVREVAGALAAVLGRDGVMVDVPIALGRLMAILGEGRARLTGGPEPVLTRYTLATLAWSQTFDLAETELLIGFRPRFDALSTLLGAAGALGR